MDGSGIPLDQAPGGFFDPAEFWTRKKCYALDLCAVCYSSLRFTLAFIDWPNSVGDSRIWASIWVSQHPGRCFSTGEHLLGDNVYSVTQFTKAPYKRPQAVKREGRRFNYYLSNLRVDMEHAFGVLKGRWSRLQSFRIRLQKEEDYGRAGKWINAYLVLHNMMVSLNDKWKPFCEEEE